MTTLKLFFIIKTVPEKKPLVSNTKFKSLTELQFLVYFARLFSLVQ